MNRQHLLSRLGQRHSVLFSNGPWSIWDRQNPEFLSAPLWGCFEHIDGVDVDSAPRVLLTHPLKRLWDRAATLLASMRLKRRISSSPGGALIAYVFHPSYVKYALAARPDLLVYGPYDLFSATPGWGVEDATQESALLGACDLVIAASDAIRGELASRTGSPVFCVPNGVDAEAFERGSQLPAPPDIASIPHPRIGYVGSLNRKVDFALIEELARSNPPWQFVLIGASFGHDDRSREAMRRCEGLSNVHFLGMKRPSQLPAYMAALDVGVMCYLRGSWCEYGYPLKLHEYLAAGLPVVSVDLPAVEEFSDLILMAKGASAWAASIREALEMNSEPCKSARREVARQNSWDLRVDRIEGHLIDALRFKPLRTYK